MFFEDVIRRDCLFSIYRYPLKTLGKPEITPDEMRVLLEDKPIRLENLRRKDGRLFSCYGLLEHRDTGGWGIRFVRSAERGIRFVRAVRPGTSTLGSPLQHTLGKTPPTIEAHALPDPADINGGAGSGEGTGK